MRFISILIGLAIACVLYGIPVFSSGNRNIGKIENIHGIPYPYENKAFIVEEKLAHVDIFLEEPVLGKQLTLTVAFDPGTAQAIDIGVREGGFWLGYVKKSLYRKGVDTVGFQTKEVQFPLSSMFQDTDRSIDIMFFADREVVSWKIDALRATVKPVSPTFQEIKEYGKSILVRERAL